MANEGENQLNGKKLQGGYDENFKTSGLPGHPLILMAFALAFDKARTDKDLEGYIGNARFLSDTLINRDPALLAGVILADAYGPGGTDDLKMFDNDAVEWRDRYFAKETTAYENALYALAKTASAAKALSEKDAERVSGIRGDAADVFRTEQERRRKQDEAPALDKLQKEAGLQSGYVQEFEPELVRAVIKTLGAARDQLQQPLPDAQSPAARRRAAASGQALRP